MATTVTAAGKDLAVTALANAGAYACLHIVNGTEVSGGSPAYARKAVTFTTTTNDGVAVLSGAVVFDVPACTVAYVSLNSAASGAGTEYARAAVTNEIFAAQGTYTLTTSTTITLADPA